MRCRSGCSSISWIESVSSVASSGVTSLGEVAASGDGCFSGACFGESALGVGVFEVLPPSELLNTDRIGKTKVFLLSLRGEYTDEDNAPPVDGEGIGGSSLDKSGVSSLMDEASVGVAVVLSLGDDSGKVLSLLPDRSSGCR